jgi:hypothetical protein
MNWHLLANLVTGYTALFFILGWALRPGRKYLDNRFMKQFHRPVSEEAIASLSHEERAVWDRICKEYDRTPFRWFEVLYMLFHYPSVIVLSAILRRDALSLIPMYFITGTTYVAALYFFLH